MPSNKILTALILCLGVVISIWLFARTPENISPAKETVGSISVEPYKIIENSNTTDWKKILVSVDPKNQAIVENLSKDNSNTFDETTVTAKVAKDFFSQYLLAIKNGKVIDQQTADEIAKNTLSVPEYTKTSGPVYLVSNLHITSQIDKATLQKYKDALNLILKNRSAQIKNNPVTILNTTIKTGNKNELLKLNPIIDIGRGFISDFLAIEVPANMVSMHLALLNSMSNLLFDVEGMKLIFDDPIRSLSGIGQYSKHALDFQNALTNINNYLEKNL